MLPAWELAAAVEVLWSTITICGVWRAGPLGRRGPSGESLLLAMVFKLELIYLAPPACGHHDSCVILPRSLGLPVRRVATALLAHHSLQLHFRTLPRALQFILQ